jgi:hypothetical protein
LNNRLCFTRTLYKMTAYIHEQSSEGYKNYKHLIPGSSKLMTRIFYIKDTHLSRNTQHEYDVNNDILIKQLARNDQLLERELIINLIDRRAKFIIKNDYKIIEQISFPTIYFHSLCFNLSGRTFKLPESLQHKRFYQTIEKVYNINLVDIYLTLENYLPFSFEKMWIEEVLTHYYNQTEHLISSFVFILPEEYHNQFKVSLDLFWKYQEINVKYRMQSNPIQ